MANHENFPKLNAYILHTMSNIVEFVGWEKKENEHHTTSLLRSIVISRMGQLGHEATVAKAKEAFAAHVSGSKPIPADLRAAVYRTVAANGDEKTLDQLKDLHNTNELHEEKDRISRAMGSFTDESLLQQVLSFAMSNDVRSQDAPFVIGSLAANPKGRALAWDYFKSNYDTFHSRYKTGMLMNRLIKFTSDGFASEERANEVEAFFKERQTPAEMVINQSIENIR